MAVLEGDVVGVMTHGFQAGELFAGRVEDRQELEAGRLRGGLVILLSTRGAGAAGAEPTGSVLADVAVVPVDLDALVFPFFQFEGHQIRQNVIPGISEDS